MTKTKLKTTPWKEIRAKRVKTPEDEARIAQAREAMEAERQLAAVRKKRQQKVKQQWLRS